MTNVTVDVQDEQFSLLDSNGAKIFTHEEWSEVTNYADSNNLNIVYYPKDLIFSFVEDGDNICVYVDVKYGDGGHDNLGGHNVRGLPSYIDKSEDMECHFAILEEIPKKRIIKDMIALGARFENNDNDEDGE